VKILLTRTNTPKDYILNHDRL